jgi:cell wall assembly regulator SMI1
MHSIEANWHRIDAWFQSQASGLYPPLPTGVSEEALQEAEALMGARLPEDFKASYRLHNGWDAKGALLGRLTLYPLAGVVEVWQMMHDLLEAGDFDRGLGWKHEPLHFQLADPIRPVWWHLGWVPFAGDEWEEATEWAVDLAPAPGGQEGQVIEWEHETGPGRIRSTSFAALLETFADELEAGEYIVFDYRVERRLTKGLEAEEQARRYAVEHPSPARELLDQAAEWKHADAWTSDIVQERLALYHAALQELNARQVDRFDAYSALITIYCVSGQRTQAEQTLAAYAAEIASLPQDHWAKQGLQRLAEQVEELELTWAINLVMASKTAEAVALLTHLLEEEGRPLLVRSRAGGMLASFYGQVQQPEEAHHFETEERRLREALQQDVATQVVQASSGESWVPPRLSPARRLLKQAYDVGRTSTGQNLAGRLRISESTTRQMIALLLEVLELAEAQLEDRLLAYEWLIELELSLHEHDQAQALFVRCQTEAKQAPAHYEIHRFLLKVAPQFDDTRREAGGKFAE